MKKACLIFDVLYQHLNVTVFDQDYNVLFHKTEPKYYSQDEDGHKCEDLQALVAWVQENYKIHTSSSEYSISAVNFNSYAGALVHLDANHKPLMPVYDIDKPFGYKTKKALVEVFEKYHELGNEIQVTEISFEAGALQLFWIKENKNEIFHRIKSSLSIAQFLQFTFTGTIQHDHTSVGCHSGAWNFDRNSMHKWLVESHINSYNLPIVKSNSTVKVGDISYGAGLYSKVSELQPFLDFDDEQFILLSTGAWTVCINPFNTAKASKSDRRNNCFNILDTDGKRIKMARLFSGNEHTRQIQHLAKHFGLDGNHCFDIEYDDTIVRRLRKNTQQVTPDGTNLGHMLDSPFMERNLNQFSSIEEAYHQFIMDLVAQQIASIRLTADHQINRKIYVEGGLAKNSVFMELLSEAFHDKAIYKVGFEDTAALGAAMLISDTWGAGKFSPEMLQLELI